MADRLLAGWGRATASVADVRAAGTEEAIAAAMRAEAPRGLLVRGRGRAYGDAAQNAGGIVLDLSSWRDIAPHVEDGSVVTVGAGASLRDLTRWALGRGLFPPVLPGTGQVSLGGAVAADIHGKNHCADASIGAHIAALRLIDGTATTRTLGPERDPDAFWATVGGMGLTGVVTSVTIRLQPVRTAWMRTSTERLPNLDACLARMASVNSRYAVAWLDSSAQGKDLGRAVLTHGEHAEPGELLPRDQANPLGYRPRNGVPLIWPWPWTPITARTVAAFNELKFRQAKPQHAALQQIGAFFHPLDAIQHWNRLYGRAGFLQYQFAVPDRSAAVVRQVLERLAVAKYPTFLSVLKRLGGGTPGPLSFPIAGWTLAVDLPTGLPGLAGVLDELDAVVAAAGGRVYLAKDSRLRPDVLAAMYPQLDTWRATRARLDPSGRLRSDLDRRLDLTGRQRGTP